MFERVTLHGKAGSILWGYRPAVTFRSWKIYKHEGKWYLAGTAERVDPFMARQTPLLFSAPRDKGIWAWGVNGPVSIVADLQVRAELGPPEQ